MVRDCELLQHGTAAANRTDPVVATLAPGQLELHKALASVGEDGEADVGDPGAGVEAIDGPHQLEDLEVIEGGDGAEGVVGAAVELHLLEEGAAFCEGKEAGAGGVGDGDAKEVGAGLGDRFESGVDVGGVEEG